MSRPAALSISERELQPARPAESVETFACLGSTCSVIVAGSGPDGSAGDATARAKRTLLEWHARFSRFEPASELSRLNRTRRRRVHVSRTMTRFVQAAVEAAAFTHGLVDPTLVGELERAGYAGHFESASLPLRECLALAPGRAPASARPGRPWRRVQVDAVANTVSRPVGVRLDSGGLAKGLFGDWLATVLEAHASFAVNAAGDVRFGGRANLIRPVRVASPFEESILHVFELRRGAAATSGIGKRSWLDRAGRPAHHLLDPGTGRPAFTGIVQVTALAPRGLEAEARAKAALLSGPAHAPRWLTHGGVIVYDDGSFDVIAPDERLA